MIASAEGLALLLLLILAEALAVADLRVYGDSELWIKRMNKEFSFQNHALQNLGFRVNLLVQKFQKVDFVHIFREQNDRADGLSKAGLFEDMDMCKIISNYQETREEKYSRLVSFLY